jgi:DNA-binding IclR family transcriptional regulator
MSEVRSAGRVLDLLEYLQAGSAPQSLSAIAHALLLPKSSTLQLLRTLVGHGYAIRDEDGHYVAVEAPARAEHRRLLLDAAIPVMAEFCGSLRETLILGVMTHGGMVRALAKEVSPQELRYDADLSALRPSYCTAMGRVLLAALPLAQRRRALNVQPLRAFTPHTLTDPEALEAVLQHVRQLGYATIEEQYAEGCSGAAAPIRDARDQVIGALDVASVVPRFSVNREQLVRGAIAAADRISARLREVSL